MRYFFSCYIILALILFDLPVYAAGAEELFDSVIQQSKVSNKDEFKKINQAYLELYFWSKDSFEVKDWPEYWSELSRWSEGFSHQNAPGYKDLALVTRATHALFCHDYAQTRALLSKASIDGEERFYIEMIKALLGEQVSSEPGVWQISVVQARQIVQDYPQQALSYVLLAEAILERQNSLAESDLKSLLEAQKSVVQALKLNADLDYAHFQQGQIYYLQQDYVRAKTYFTQHVLPLGAVAIESVGNFYSWMKSPQEAIEYLEQARQKDPNNQRIYQKMEMQYLHVDPAQAVFLYLSGLKDSQDKHFYYQKLQSLYQHASVEMIDAWIKQEKQADNYFLKLTRGDLALQKEQPEEAIDWYLKALKQKPQESQAYLNLIQLFWDTGRTEEMKQILLQAQAEKLKNPEINYWQGVLALEEERFSEAISILKPLAQGNVRARYTLMMAYRRKQDYAQAYQLLASLLNQEPNNFSLLLILGDMYLEQERFNDAEQAYLLAGKVEPYHEQVYYSLGNLFSRQGQQEKAVIAYEKAILINPLSLDIRNNLGNIFIRQHRFEEAQDLFLNILEHDLNYASAHYNLACIYALKGEKNRALQYLEAAFKLDADLKKIARQDSDLHNLKNERHFRKLITP